MLIRGDARHLPLKDSCVDCCVTSPPYWGLRQYPDQHQIGDEGSPAEYVAELVLVFREVARALKPTGSLWLNLGDCYANGDKGGYARTRVKAEDSMQRSNLGANFIGAPNRSWQGLARKNLVGIPWLVAFALQADGWYLRSDIIWAKPNPMPESVTDRPTKAHEYLFLLTKSEKYYYDAAAIAEPVSAAMLAEVEQGYEGLGLKEYEAAGVQNPSSVKARIIANAQKKQDCPFGLTRNKRTVWTIKTQPYRGSHFATMPEALIEPCILAGSPLGGIVFDPCVGSGTVVAVAQRLGRRGVGVDLSYQLLAKERTAQQGLSFVGA